MQLKRVIPWIYAAAFEMAAILSAAVLKPFSKFSEKRVLYPEKAGRPILLVHGYLHDASAWAYHKKKLQKEGFGPVYTINLGSPFSSIALLAEKVRKKALEIQKNEGRSDLILIGHSMGGLVSAFYATQLAPSGKVTDVITIGSPLQGTYMASIGIGANAKEMRRGSLFVKKLQKAMTENQTIRFCHIASSTDALILPQDSAISSAADAKTALLDGVGHVALLYSSRVFRQISHWLRD